MGKPSTPWAVAAPLLLAHASAAYGAPLSPLPPSRAEAMERLVAWVQENGGFVSERLEVGCLPGRGVAVCARGEILEGEELLRVPGALDLGRSVVLEDSPLLAALDRAGSWGTQVSVQIATQLQRRSAGEPAGSQAFFVPFWDALDLDACCAHMPYFRDSAEWELLKGSAEFHRRSEYARLSGLVTDLASLAEEDPDLGLGILNETKFIMADHFISTHAFTDREGRHRLMPLAINLNHDIQARAGAQWYWDSQSENLHIVASRSVAPGEEVTISYGLKSNAQLMSRYGFTLEPAAEPIHSFHAAAVGDFLPPDSEARDLNFRVRLVTLPAPAPPAAAASGPASRAAVTAALERMRPLLELLQRSSASGLDPEDVLRDFVRTFSAQLEEDEVVSDFVAQLRENRLQPGRAGSAVWWCLEGSTLGLRGAAGSGACPEDGSSAEALGSHWLSDVVRMKMSGYLCLLAYSEALDLRAGALAADEALPAAVALLPLVDALLRLGRSQREAA